MEDAPARRAYCGKIDKERHDPADLASPLFLRTTTSVPTPQRRRTSAHGRRGSIFNANLAPRSDADSSSAPALPDSTVVVISTTKFTLWLLAAFFHPLTRLECNWNGVLQIQETAFILPDLTVARTVLWTIPDHFAAYITAGTATPIQASSLVEIDDYVVRDICSTGWHILSIMKSLRSPELPTAILLTMADRGRRHTTVFDWLANVARRLCSATSHVLCPRTFPLFYGDQPSTRPTAQLARTRFFRELSGLGTVPQSHRASRYRRQHLRLCLQRIFWLGGLDIPLGFLYRASSIA